jgi:hypothetical protein
MDGSLLRAARLFNPGNFDQYGAIPVSDRYTGDGAGCVRAWRPIPLQPFV